MNRTSAITCILILALLAGCTSEQEKVVATVGSKQVTLGHVRDYDIMFRRLYESAQEEFDAKKRYVDSLIEVRLLIIGAYQNDLDVDREVLEIVDIEKPKFLLDELFKKQILAKVSVTDAEVRDQYEKLKEELHVKHILLDRKDLADSLYEAITRGAEFEQTARDFSLDKSTAMNGGDLGYIRWGWMVESFEDRVFAMSPGQVSTPFESEMGWHIVLMVDRRESPSGPFEEVRDGLRGQIESLRRQKVMMEYLLGLRQRIDIRINDEVYGELLNLVNRMYPDSMGGKPFKKSSIDLDLLEAYQRSKILAYFKGGELTVEHYMMGISQWPIKDRPDFRDAEAVKAAVFNMHLNLFLVLEAGNQGLDDTESFRRVIGDFKELVMADKMRELIAKGAREVVDDDIYDYYNDHIDEFTVGKQLQVREIMLSDRALAESLRSAIDGGADFAQLAGEYTERPGMKSRQGDLGYVEPYKHPEVYQAAENMRLREIRGPVKTGEDKWSIIRLEDSKPPVTHPIEEVAVDIRTELGLQRQAATLEKWLEAKRAETTISVDYDLIWETIDRGKYAYR